MRRGIVALGISLGWFVVVVRAVILGASWASLRSPAFLAKAVGASYVDLAYVLGLTLVAALFARLVGRSKTPSRLLRLSFAALAVVSLVAAAGNIQAVQMIGRPFTYPWLVYADFFRTQDGQAAVKSALTPRALVSAASLVSAMLLLGAMLRVCLRGAARCGVTRRLGLGIFAAACICYFPSAYVYCRHLRVPAGKVANPLVAFAVSLLESRQLPPLFAAETPFGPDDVRAAGERAAERPTDSKSAPAPAGKIRNVAIFVFESVAAEYTDPSGGGYGVTPNLDACRAHAVRFTSAYAHIPSTNNSIASMFCSLYPPTNRQSITRDYNAVRVDALSDVLHRAGFRTGCFNAGDLEFARTGEFLARHSFDVLEDYRSRPADHLLVDTTEDLPETDGIDDVTMVDRLTQWIGTGEKQPFFGVAWTVMTHYPYYTHGDELPLVDRSTEHGRMLNRYLNALRRGDEGLGHLLRHLRENGLADSTLVIVVGDHGEAFGRHGTYGHAGGIYEENLHVPLLLVHPGLFHGEVNDAVVGLVDLAPTVLRLLDLPSPPAWQGRSLFDRTPADRVYFECPYSDYVFGYREGAKVFLFNGSLGTHEMYDLATDPQQLHDLMPQNEKLIPEIHGRLAAWVQYQTKLISTLSGGKRS